MAQLKTRRNGASVDDFLDAVDKERRREECRTINDMMRRVTGEDGAMWGDSIVGFGSYHYKYASGREGDWFLTGFAPRKQALTVYIMPGFTNFNDLMAKVGKHKTAKSCLYIKKLEDVDLDVLEDLVAKSIVYMRETYGA